MATRKAVAAWVIFAAVAVALFLAYRYFNLGQ